MSTPTLPDARLLRRSSTEKKIAGVCGGLGQWSNIDPVVYRIAMVVLAVFGGLGLLGYGLIWLLAPAEDEPDSLGQRLVAGRFDPVMLWPGLLILVGLGAAGGSWAQLGAGSAGLLIVAALVVAAVLVQRSRDSGAGGSDNGGAAMTSSTSPSAPGSTPYGATPPAQAPYVDRVGGPGPAPQAGPPPGPPSPSQPPRRPREPRSLLGGLTVSIALIAAGSMVSWGYLTSTSVSVRLVLSVALGVVAAGLLVGTFWGRSRGLIVLGVLLSLVVLTSGLRGVTVPGGIGDQVWRPTSVATLASPYELSVGNATLDLTSLALGSTPVQVSARLGVGDLLIIVPADATVRLAAHVGTGNVRVPGAQYGGMGVDRSLLLAGVGDANGEIVIDAQVGIGQLEVRRA